MASTTLAELLHRSYPQALSGSSKSSEIALEQLRPFPEEEYTSSEKEEIRQWLATSQQFAEEKEDLAKRAERLSSLNLQLASRTTLLGAKPSIADIAIYVQVASVVKSWSAEERTGERGYHHIVRFVDFVQNAPLFGLKVDEKEKVEIDANNVQSAVKTVNPRAAEKEKKKKERERELAASGATAGTSTTHPTTTNASEPKLAEVSETSRQEGGKKKKEKGAKAGKATAAATPAAEKPLSPALIDLRVGHILKAEKHPNADSLYVSTIAVGDKAGTELTTEYEGQVVRTVCSGLNGLVPLEEMQGRRVVAVCNLKPVTMRGVKSAAMVLAASPRAVEGAADAHAGPVELVNPPSGASAGDRVYFEGWEGEPEPVLNPKKKVWESCQVGFTTTDDMVVAFQPKDVSQLSAGDQKDTARLRTEHGYCTVTSLKGAAVR